MSKRTNFAVDQNGENHTCCHKSRLVADGTAAPTGIDTMTSESPDVAGARDRSVDRLDLLPRAVPVGGDHRGSNLGSTETIFDRHLWSNVTTDHGQEMKQLANKSIIAEFAAVIGLMELGVSRDQLKPPGRPIIF